MKKNSTGGHGPQTFKTVQARLLVIFIVIVVAVTSVIAIAMLERSSRAIKNNASELIAANSNQIQLNINSYLEKVEQNSALLFSTEDYYKYDETDPDIDEYTKLLREEAIVNRIVDLGIMENFSDFGIVYSDNYSVGWLSNTTKGLYDSDKMYEELASNITDDKTADGWFFGVNGNYDRLYYIKRLNENAVLVASFYSRDLASVFQLSDKLSGMIIRLINDDNIILYSSDKDEIGQSMPEKISSLVGSNSSVSIMDSDYLINVNVCENGWRVVCAVPSSVILAETASLRNFTITMSVLLAVLFAIVGSLVLLKLSNPVNSLVSDLENRAAVDGLSGLLNKVYFGRKISEELALVPRGNKIAFMIMDVDHFKSINDTEGHAYGDQVIVRTAELLKKKLPLDSITGRVGGDEFAFYIKGESENLQEYVDEILTNLSAGFLMEFEREHRLYNVSLSIGAYVKHYEGEDFETVYRHADSALYASKEGGRNRYTFYQEGMNGET